MSNNFNNTVGLNSYFGAQPQKTDDSKVSMKDILKPVARLFNFVDPVTQGDAMIDFWLPSKKPKTSKKLTNTCRK
jgi:hypothetical protein